MITLAAIPALVGAAALGVISLTAWRTRAAAIDERARLLKIAKWERDKEEEWRALERMRGTDPDLSDPYMDELRRRQKVAGR